MLGESSGATASFMKNVTAWAKIPKVVPVICSRNETRDFLLAHKNRGKVRTRGCHLSILFRDEKSFRAKSWQTTVFSLPSGLSFHPFRRANFVILKTRQGHRGKWSCLSNIIPRKRPLEIVNFFVKTLMDFGSLKWMTWMEISILLLQSSFQFPGRLGRTQEEVLTRDDHSAVEFPPSFRHSAKKLLGSKSAQNQESGRRQGFNFPSAQKRSTLTTGHLVKVCHATLS